MTTGDSERSNAGWLQSLEKPALAWLVNRLPPQVTPDSLTALGLAGAVVVFAGYALAARYPACLWLASAGLAINWFGDSLDGTLARFRRTERPRYGYFVDNGVDAIAQFLLAAGIGLSGLIRWDLCFLALSTYLMFSTLTFVRANISGEFKIDYAGIGPTEMRAAFIVLNTAMFFWPPVDADAVWMTYPNLLSLAWSSISLVLFLMLFIAEARLLAKQEPPRP